MLVANSATYGGGCDEIGERTKRHKTEVLPALFFFFFNSAVLALSQKARIICPVIQLLSKVDSPNPTRIVLILFFKKKINLGCYRKIAIFILKIKNKRLSYNP